METENIAASGQPEVLSSEEGDGAIVIDSGAQHIDGGEVILGTPPLEQSG